VEADEAAVRRIAALPQVARIEPVARTAPRLPPPAPGPESRAGPAGGAVPQPAGMLEPMLAELGITTAQTLGFAGAGVRIAVFDTGFDLTHPALAGLRVFATWDFIGDDPIVSAQAGDPAGTEDHGTAVWSVVGGDDPGVLRGAAWQAEYALARVEDLVTETRAEEDRWVAAIEWADSLGADVVNSSLGYRDFDDGFVYPFAALDGRTTPTSVAADEAARRGIVVVTAMGNAGPGRGTLIAPADAEGAVSVGAVDANGQPASFTSRGPTADGRIKPDVAARGVAVPSARARGGYWLLSGTSLATPLIAGGAGLLREAWPAMHPDEVRRVLTETGTHATRPDTAIGYGLPDFAAAILYPTLIAAAITGADADGRLNTTFPVFAWELEAHGLASPARFIVELSASASFQTTLRADTAGDVRELMPARAVTVGTPWYWRVVVEDDAGVRRASPPAGPYRSVAGPPAQVVTLHQNFPNPFPRADLGLTVTRIWFDLPAPSNVHLAVYDLRGRLVRTLIPNRAAGCGDVTLDAGEHGRADSDDICVRTTWNGADDAGRTVPAGVYLLRLRAGGREAVRRMVYVP
jgi:hypothetical protein